MTLSAGSERSGIFKIFLVCGTQQSDVCLSGFSTLLVVSSLNATGQARPRSLTLVLAMADIDGEEARGDVGPSDIRLALLYTDHILQVFSSSVSNE
jgi:hypothetical protein